MRAARYDLLIETGARLIRSFKACTPGEPVTAATVGPGDRIYYKGSPLYVYSRTEYRHPVDANLDTVTFTFNTGAWYEPTVTIPAHQLVHPAIFTPITSASAGFTEITYPVVTPLTGPPPVEAVHPLPVTLTDGFTVTLEMSDAQTAELRDKEGAWSWDLYAQTAAWQWVRLVEGTLSIVGGSGRA